MNNKGEFIIGIIAFLIAAAIFGSSGSNSSSTGRKWSDLSETEKQNARWAYEVSQALKGK